MKRRLRSQSSRFWFVIGGGVVAAKGTRRPGCRAGYSRAARLALPCLGKAGSLASPSS